MKWRTPKGWKAPETAAVPASLLLLLTSTVGVLFLGREAPLLVLAAFLAAGMIILSLSEPRDYYRDKMDRLDPRLKHADEYPGFLRVLRELQAQNLVVSIIAFSVILLGPSRTTQFLFALCLLWAIGGVLWDELLKTEGQRHFFYRQSTVVISLASMYAVRAIDMIWGPL